MKKQNTRDNALLVRKTNMLGQETVGEKNVFSECLLHAVGVTKTVSFANGVNKAR